MRPGKSKVIISDLDGTLLNNHHQISEYTRAIFKEAHQKGHLIIVATGRHHLDAMPLVAQLGVPLYLITSNGARIHSPERELLFAVNMEAEAVKAILALAIDPEITIVVYKEDVWQTNRHNEKLNSFSKEVSYHRQLVNFEELNEHEAIKIFFTHEDQSKLQEVKDLILEQHPDTFNPAFSLPICLELMDKKVDKRHAIAKILEIEKLDFSQAISFGDGFNDELMLTATGKGCIMGNAPETLKNKLSHLEVITTNQEEGVANYLSNFVLTNQ